MSGSLRANVGKKDAKKIRSEGQVPCVIYGGKDQVQFYMNDRNFEDIVFTPEVCFIKITIDGKEYDVVLQDIQYHPVTDSILHADFMELSPERHIVMNIPVKITGTAPGVLKGGKLDQKLRKLKVKALPEFMPDFINVSIDGMDIGNAVKVADIPSENISLLDNKNNVIISVKVTRAVEETPADKAAVAPAEVKKEG
jgi:large subunit ribosomal protein L25